jgi:hypothetical protein
MDTDAFNSTKAAYLTHVAHLAVTTNHGFPSMHIAQWRCLAVLLPSSIWNILILKFESDDVPPYATSQTYIYW